MRILSLCEVDQWTTGPIISRGVEVEHQKIGEMSKLQKTDWNKKIKKNFPFSSVTIRRRAAKQEKKRILTLWK